MATSVAKAVKKYLLPIMEANGYTYRTIPGAGVWDFIKTGEREQTVLVDQYHPKTLRLEMRLTPSYRHTHIAIEDAYWNRLRKQDAILGGWVYRNQKELEEIIRVFARAMEEKGFAIMEAAANDPLDIVPTLEMQQDLYQNHQQYALEWAEKVGLQTWQHDEVFSKIANELLELKKQGLQELETGKFKYLAAAYGMVFEKMGCQWEMWKQKQAILYKPCGYFMFRAIPLTTMYHFWHYGTQENAEELLRNSIKSYEYYQSLDGKNG